MALYHYQAELGLTPQEVWFVGYILAHRWTAALPFPSLRQMSRRTGISTQMLHRYKQSLIEKGYLETIARHRPSGGRTSNYYDFSALFQALERSLTRDRRDAAWQPTADEADTLDDVDESGGSTPGSPGQWQLLDRRGSAADPEPVEGAGPIALPAPRPRRALLRDRAVPVSQQRAEAVSSNLVASRCGAGQPELTGPSNPEGAGAGAPELAGAAPLAEPAPAQTGYLQERRAPFHNALHADRARASDAQPPGRSNAETLERFFHNATERWERALTLLASHVSAATLNSWLRPLIPVEQPDGDPGGEGAALTLVCPTAFHREQVRRHYLPSVEQAAGSAVRLVLPSLDARTANGARS